MILQNNAIYYNVCFFTFPLAWDAPQTLLGSLLLPYPLDVFKGPVSKGMEEKGEKIGREGGKNGGRGP